MIPRGVGERGGGASHMEERGAECDRGEYKRTSHCVGQSTYARLRQVRMAGWLEGEVVTRVAKLKQWGGWSRWMRLEGDGWQCGFYSASAE